MGVDKMKTLWSPPPLHPLPPGGGEIFGRICLINYGLLSNTAAILLERTAVYQQKVLPPHPSYPRKRVSRVSCENRNQVLNVSLLSQGRSLDSRSPIRSRTSFTGMTKKSRFSINLSGNIFIRRFDREFDAEGRTLAYLAFHFNITIMALNDSVTDG